MPEFPEPRTPLAYVYDRERDEPDRVFLRQPVNREFNDYTWGRLADEARRLARALQSMGIGPGDRVAIFSKNCAEWFVADLAIMMADCISVPLYSTANETTISHIFEHSGAKAAFVGKLDDWSNQVNGFPEHVIRIAMPYLLADCQYQWNDLLETFEPIEGNPEPDIDQTMTLIYTSGSTGKPKGAVHSYRNFVFAGQRIGYLMGTRPDDRILSYLPLAHCTERAYVEATTLIHGGTVHFAESLETFTDDMLKTQPTMFGSVPRLWKRFQLGVLEKMPEEKINRLLKWPILRGVVRKKIRAALGLGACRWLMSGSAPIAPTLLNWWARLEMPIAEGWGMTESLAYGTTLKVGDKIRVGSIGKAAPDTDVRISDDGEIQIRTGCLMQGYYNDPEKTNETFTDDGFLRTGDCGEIDSDGYIFITGRVKDIYKTAKGKYVAPVPIESQIVRNKDIEQACLIGSGMKQPVALIELAETAASIDRQALTDRLEETLTMVNQALESHERIDRFVVVKYPWTVENGLLTPTLKIKRHALEAHYGERIRAKFDARVVFEADSKIEAAG